MLSLSLSLSLSPSLLLTSPVVVSQFSSATPHLRTIISLLISCLTVLGGVFSVIFSANVCVCVFTFAT